LPAPGRLLRFANERQPREVGVEVLYVEVLYKF
jgi:hypothetical protein